MTEELRLEIEALIQEQLRHRSAAQVQEGWDQAQRGELFDGDAVREEMRRFKDAWKQRRRTE